MSNQHILTLSAILLAAVLTVACTSAASQLSPTVPPTRSAIASATATTAVASPEIGEVAVAAGATPKAASGSTPSAVAALDAHTWTIAAGSVATFTVREQLAGFSLPNDAVVKSTAMTGTLRRQGPSEITLDLRQMSSDSSRRDRYMRDTMFRSINKATFTLEETPPRHARRL